MCISTLIALGTAYYGNMLYKLRPPAWRHSQYVIYTYYTAATWYQASEINVSYLMIKASQTEYKAWQ